MLTPSSMTSQAIIAWVPAYMALLVHGAFLTPADSYIMIFLVYPALCGIPLALFSYFQEFEDESLLEKIGIPDTEYIRLSVVLWLALPLGFVLSAMAYAQLERSYDQVSWIVIVFGGLTINELGKKLKQINSQK